MPIERTVAQTVNLLVKSIRTEIEKAAKDTVLTPAEQKQLTPWVKTHIDEIRQPGKKVTVTSAVNHLKPIINRAALAIAGGDGKIDAEDVKKLRVTELRTRAASLFDGGGTSGNARAKLNAAIKATQIAPIRNYGKEFYMDEFPSGKTLGAMIASITGNSEDDLGPVNDWGDTTAGSRAVTKFNTVLRDAVEGDAVDTEDPAVAVKIRSAYKGIETAAKEFFNADDF